MAHAGGLDVGQDVLDSSEVVVLFQMQAFDHSFEHPGVGELAVVGVQSGG